MYSVEAYETREESVAHVQTVSLLGLFSHGPHTMEYH
jgi:hypothetical protein